MQANGGISDRQATVASSGFDLDSVGGTIGTEYRINNNAFVGGAFDYSNPKARLFNNAGTTDLNSYQLGIYGAWARLVSVAKRMIAFKIAGFSRFS
jgi:outer membrane autotransporter protein